MNDLFPQIADNQIVGFILVLARLTPLFLFAPMLSSKMVPMRIRGIVAVGLALGMAPLALKGQAVPTDGLSIATLVAKELFVGLVFAFIIGLLFAALSVAGTIIDTIIGFSFGAMVDPITGNQGTVLSQTYALMGVMVFIAIGGDEWMVAGFAKTFELVPLLEAPNIDRALDGAIQAFTGIFTAAVQICAPVLLALLLTDIAFGLVTKVVPTLNVFSMGLPTKVVVGIVVMAASLPFVGGYVHDEMLTSVETALRSLGVS